MDVNTNAGYTVVLGNVKKKKRRSRKAHGNEDALSKREECGFVDPSSRRLELVEGMCGKPGGGAKPRLPRRRIRLGEVIGYYPVHGPQPVGTWH